MHEVKITEERLMQLLMVEQHLLDVRSLAEVYASDKVIESSSIYEVDGQKLDALLGFSSN